MKHLAEEVGGRRSYTHTRAYSKVLASSILDRSSTVLHLGFPPLLLKHLRWVGLRLLSLWLHLLLLLFAHFGCGRRGRATSG